MKKLTLLFATLALFLAAPGCGDDNDDPEPSVEEEGCEHMEEGPFAARTATADTTNPPDIGVEHTRVDLELVSYMGGMGGFGSFEAEEETDYIFFLSADIPLTILDSGQNAVAIEDSEVSEFCPTEVPMQHVVELAVGTYFLEFGGATTTETTVGIVHEEFGGHAH